MAEHAAHGSASAANSSSSSAFLSPVSKYNKLREDERIAQQERLKSVRVEHTSTTVTGKRKLESAESSTIAASTSPSVTFADASSSVSTSRSVTSSSTSKAAALTASLAKKKQRRSGASTVRTSTESASSSSSSRRRGSSESKSISGIMKKYMKKVEAEKRDPAAPAASTLHAAHAKHHLTYDAMKQVLSTRTTTTSSSSSSLQSPEMFSRAVDASFHRSSSSAKPQRVLKHFDSLAVAKNKFERQREAAEAEDDDDDHHDDDDPSSLYTPRPKLPKRAARLVTAVKDEDVVDLEHVADVSSLETVEGSEILAALRNTGTPRTGRTFPSERAQPASDERDRAFLQRRHLALRKKYTAVPDTDRSRQPDDDKWAYTESATGTIVIERKTTAVSSSEVSGRAARKLNVEENEDDDDGADDEPAPDDSATADAEDDQRAPAESVSKTEDDSDRESTASKIARISAVKRASWRTVVLGLVASACVAVIAVVALPALALAFAPALPFCDSSERSVVASIDAFDRSTALQAYTADATASASCRPCPVFGTCSDGALASCLPPYERVDSACVEDPDVQHELQRVASVIHDFVVSKAAAHIANVSLWTALVGDDASASGAVARVAAPVQILLSELQDALASTIAYGKALAKLPRDYVFHRALDLALRDLHDIFVTDANELFVGPRAAPWTVRAKHAVFSYARVVLSLVVASLVAVFAYRHVQIRRLERSLVDRLVKEVRFALLQRTAKPDKWYPADYLRDDLFDILPDVTPQHRAWLRDTVWPRVVALVHDDSRVRSSSKTVSGEKMVVWEWVPVASPSKAPTTLAAAKQALVKLAGRRRTKASRKSFPM